jgi:hypothetical protein
MKSAVVSNRKKREKGSAPAVRTRAATSDRKPVRATRQVEPEITPDLDMEWLREGPKEIKEADALADKVFASVLERCGWQRNERGEIEHRGGRK